MGLRRMPPRIPPEARAPAAARAYLEIKPACEVLVVLGTGLGVPERGIRHLHRPEALRGGGVPAASIGVQAQNQRPVGAPQLRVVRLDWGTGRR